MPSPRAVFQPGMGNGRGMKVQTEAEPLTKSRSLAEAIDQAAFRDAPTDGIGAAPRPSWRSAVWRVVAAMPLALAGASLPATGQVSIVGSIYCNGEWIRGDLECTAQSRKDAERAGQVAANKAREDQREQQRIDALVAAETKRLGAHRAEEARRLVEMREQAASVRPRQPAVAAAPVPNPPPAKCVMRPVTAAISSGPHPTIAAAQADFNRQAALACRTSFIGTPECKTHATVISVGQKGKSSVEKMASYCGAQVICARQERVCESRPATVSKQ